MRNVTFIQQLLLNNELFKYKGKMLCFLRWIHVRSGLLYVNDLVKKEGNENTK